MKPDPRWTAWLEQFSAYYASAEFEKIPRLFPNQTVVVVVVPDRLYSWPKSVRSPDCLPGVLSTYHASGLRPPFEMLESREFGGFGHTLLETNWRIHPSIRLYVRWTLDQALPQMFVMFN
jgi:hypothetical protein